MTPEQRTSLIRLASTLPVGSPERRAIVGGLTKTGGGSALKSMMGDKGYKELVLIRRALHGANPQSTETAKLLMKVIRELDERLKMDPATQQAFNKLSNMAERGANQDAPNLTNQIFKIADLLKIPLPHAGF